MLKIINVPDKKLRLKSKPVDSITDDTLHFIDQLTEALTQKKDPPGVGLSAIQVGEPQRIFLTYLPKDPSLPSRKWNEDTLEVTAFINPRITKKSNKKSLGGSKEEPFLEGCLSIPNLYGPVWRHEWVELEYQTIQEGKLTHQNLRRSGFQARVLQHEYDHLEGILFTDYTLEDKLDLYFDEGKDLVKVSKPETLIKW